MREFVQMSKVIPEGQAGDYSIQHFQMTAEEINFACLRAALNRRWEERCEQLIPDHTYTKLVGRRGCWMSDTPLEVETNREFLARANGDVLVFGLGIGLILHPLLGAPMIRSVTCVELEQSVISLVAPHLTGLEVVQGDAFEIDFGKRKFDTIYFDIWQSRCADNYEQMQELHKRFRKNMNLKNPDRFSSSWMFREMKSLYNRSR